MTWKRDEAERGGTPFATLLHVRRCLDRDQDERGGRRAGWGALLWLCDSMWVASTEAMTSGGWCVLPGKKGHIACRVTFERARLEMVTRREGERGLDETCQTPAGCKRCAVSSRKRCADALLDGARKGVCVCRGLGDLD